MASDHVAPREAAATSRRPGGRAPDGQTTSKPTQLKRELGALGFEEQVQRLAPSATDTDGAAIQRHAAEGLRGSGGALPHLPAIQRAFGRHDVSEVQSYSGAAAGAATEAMGARAYASGEKVAFGGAPDLHTAAHEAAHVVQQRAGVSLPGGVGESGDRYEQHAEAVAAEVVRGRSAEGLLDQIGGGSGTATAREGNVQGFLGFGEEDEEGASDGGGGGGAGGVVDDVGSAMGDAWDSATETASEAWEATKEGVSQGVEATKEGISEAFDGAKEGISNGIDQITDAGHQAWEGIKQAGGEAWEAVKDAGGNAWELMKKYGAKTWKELQDILANLPGMAMNASGAGGDKSIVGLSGKVVIPGKEKTLVEAPWGEISIQPTLEVLYKIVQDPDAQSGIKILFWGGGDDKKSDAPEPKKTEVTGGSQQEGSGTGAQVEIKQELSDVLGGKLSAKAGSEGTVDAKGFKGKLGFGLETEWEDVLGSGTSVALGGEFNIVKWEAGKPPKIGVFTAVGQIKPFSVEYAFTTGALAGAKAAVEVTGKLECDINPNELWFAEKLVGAAGSLGAVPIALIAGGMLSVGIPLVQIANMENVVEGRDRAFAAGAEVHRYGADYVNGLKGSYAPTQGGSAAAQWLKDLEGKAGPDAVAKFVQDMDPGSAYASAAAQAWPKLKQQAIDAYWSAHPWEKVGSLGGYGPLSDGMKYLQMYLNDIEPSVLKY